MLAALLMGIFPEGMDISESGASLLTSGERCLWAKLENGGLEFTYIFTEEPTAALRIIYAHETDMDMKVTTKKTFPFFPDGFTVAFPDATLKGEWDKVALFDGDGTVLRLSIPGSVHVVDPGDSP